MSTENPAEAPPVETETRHGHAPEIRPRPRFSGRRLALAFAVAALADVLSIFFTFAPPVQWVANVVTAGLLFIVLGWQWSLLPGLIMEAIPGLYVFPFWVLVVGVVALWGTARPKLGFMRLGRHTNTLVAVLSIGMLTCGCGMLTKVESATKVIDDAHRAIEESTVGVQTIGKAIADTVPAITAAKDIVSGATQDMADASPAIRAATDAIEEAGHAIEEVSARVQAAGQVITDTMPAIIAAHDAIGEAIKAAVAVGPAVERATAAVEEARLEIEKSSASLKDIRGILALSSEAIDEARRCIERSSKGIDANRITIEASTKGIDENTATISRSTVAIGRVGKLVQDILDNLDRLTARKGLLGALLAAGAMLVLVPCLVFIVVLWRLKSSAAALATCVKELQSRAASVPKELS